MIFDTAGDEADSLALGKSLGWGTDMLGVSANRNKVIRITVYLASDENAQFCVLKNAPLRKVRNFGLILSSGPKAQPTGSVASAERLGP